MTDAWETCTAKEEKKITTKLSKKEAAALAEQEAAAAAAAAAAEAEAERKRQPSYILASAGD